MNANRIDHMVEIGERAQRQLKRELMDELSKRIFSDTTMMEEVQRQQNCATQYQRILGGPVPVVTNDKVYWMRGDPVSGGSLDEISGCNPYIMEKAVEKGTSPNPDTNSGGYPSEKLKAAIRDASKKMKFKKPICNQKLKTPTSLELLWKEIEEWISPLSIISAK
jgi:hypothetical protein